MNLCDYFDRLEIENGKLVRILTAKARAKRMKGRELDVFKEYEGGHTVCRNVYYGTMGGYRVAFPNEKVSLYREGYNTFEQKLEEYGECRIPAFQYHSRKLNEQEKELICSKYPDFKYVLKKYEGTIAETLELLKIWKEHKEVELVLACGFTSLVFNKSFWKMTEQKRKEVAMFIKKNPDYQYKPLSTVQTVLKYKLSDQDLEEYEIFCDSYGKVKYDVFRYLEKCGLDDFSGVQLYHDYWNLLKQTQHSRTENYWRFPKNLAQKHQVLLKEVEQIKELKEKEKIKTKQEQYFKAVKKLLKYKLEVDGYSVYIPESVEDISFQAKILNQCLITNDYISRVINKRCVLVFIRKNGCPIATAELFKGDVIGQFYCNQNNKNYLPNKKIKEVMNKWIEMKEAA